METIIEAMRAIHYIRSVVCESVIRWKSGGRQSNTDLCSMRDPWSLTMKVLNLICVSAILLGASGMAAAQGNGNGGSGGGNAHGAATAGPTTGGDNSSTPGSSRGKPHLFKHKQKKPATPATPAQ
jgi:hypothetical protein